MKKLLFFIGVLLLAAGAYIFMAKSDSPAQSIKSLIQKTNPEGNKAENSEATLPKRLSIPKLGIDAPVEYVGMDAKGNMDVPKNDNNVAWFEPGFRPGTKGNSVMAGHLDTRTGAPAVFYKLDTLEKGDRILVRGADGSSKTFIVTHKATYPYNEFPLVEVFGPSDTPRLNLITCEGRFDSTARNYSHRVVVYSELTE